MIHVEDDVAENYRQIKAERGCTWEDLARDVAHGDPRLAAWMRGQGAAEAGTQRDGKPRGRQVPRNAMTA